MAANPYPLADINLFTNAYASGVQIGKSLPSDFSAFSNAFITGIEESAKYQALQEQNAIRENEIAQIPVTNRINEANATRMEAQNAAYKSDPQTFIDAQVAKEKAEIAQQAHDAAIQKLETKWIDIQTNGTSTQKAQAIAGGEFTPLYAEKPHYYEAGYNSAGSLDKPDRDLVYASDVQKKAAEYQAKALATHQALFEKYQGPYHENDKLNAIKLSEGITDEELMRYGKVIALNLPPPKAKTEPQEVKDPKTGKTYTVNQPVLDENGGYVTEPGVIEPGDPNPKLVKTPVLLYKGKRFELDTQTLKDFSNFQAASLTLGNRAPGQSGDILGAGATVDKQKEIHVAEVQAQIDDLNKNAADHEAAFHEGLTIQPKYQAAANAVQNERAANLEQSRKIDEGVRNAENNTKINQAVEDVTAGKTPTPKPTFNPRDVPHEKYVMPLVTREPEPSPTATPETTYGPQGRPTPFLSPTPYSSPTAPPTETPDPNAKLKEDHEIRVAQAKFHLSQQPTKEPTARPVNTAQAPVPQTPTAQATTLTASTEIPKNIQLHMPGPPPSEIVTKEVASIPAVKNMNALVPAIIAAESRGKANAVSPVRYDTNGRKLGGVEGIAQMTRATANDIAVNGASFIKDPKKGIAMEAIKIQFMLDKPEFKNNPMIAAIGYNGGEKFAADAVDLAGSTDWNDIIKVIPEAARLNKFGPSKTKEIIDYAHRVASYFPLFARTDKDKERLEILRAQNLISWT